MKIFLTVVIALVVLEIYLQIKSQPRRYIWHDEEGWGTPEKTFSPDIDDGISFHILYPWKKMWLKDVREKHPDAKLRNMHYVKNVDVKQKQRQKYSVFPKKK